MQHFSAVVRTDRASRYLQQLCKHFAHKVDVAFTPEAGRVAFAPGRCVMYAGAGTLGLHGRAESAEAADAVKDILERHLVKFAWREGLEVAWTDDAPEAAKRALARSPFPGDGAAAPDAGADAPAADTPDGAGS